MSLGNEGTARRTVRSVSLHSLVGLTLLICMISIIYSCRLFFLTWSVPIHGRIFKAFWTSQKANSNSTTAAHIQIMITESAWGIAKCFLGAESILVKKSVQDFVHDFRVFPVF